MFIEAGVAHPHSGNENVVDFFVAAKRLRMRKRKQHIAAIGVLLVRDVSTQVVNSQVAREQLASDVSLEAPIAKAFGDFYISTTEGRVCEAAPGRVAGAECIGTIVVAFDAADWAAIRRTNEAQF